MYCCTPGSLSSTISRSLLKFMSIESVMLSNHLILCKAMKTKGEGSDGMSMWWWLFSLSVMSNSLQPHGLQHTRHPCPSPTPGVYSNSCPLSRWCHPTISSSVIPFSSCPQTFPESGSIPTSQLFASSGQSIGVAASTSCLPMNTRTDLLLDGLFGSPCSLRDSQESCSTTQFKSINSLAISFLYSPTLTSIHDHWKNHSLD